MTNNSTGSFFPGIYLYVVTGSVDNMIGIPVNCWVLWLIVFGKRSLIESEILTLNLAFMEIANSVLFFLSLIHYFGNLSSIGFLINFYHAVAVTARALFQCHVCVDRYLAVIHPVVFIR